MEFFIYKRAYRFMAKSPLALLISAILVLGSWGLLFTKGLNFGIDFAGGSVIQVKYESSAPIKSMREKLGVNPLFKSSSITEFGSPQEVIVRVKGTSEELGRDIGDIARELLKGSGDYEIRRVDIVGPKVGGELREQGLMAMTLAIIGILIYISFRFEWRFALSSVVALVHDVSIAIGAIIVFNIQVNLDILAALLTILGYSLNDTIIVFDRIREGVKTIKSINLEEIIDESVTRTLSRTTLTSLTTFFVVLTLFLYGGEIISGFALTLMVGVVVGTYSSIFIASPVLLRLGFSVEQYRAKEALKLKRKKERDRERAMYENGIV